MDVHDDFINISKVNQSSGSPACKLHHSSLLRVLLFKQRIFYRRPQRLTIGEIFKLIMDVHDDFINISKVNQSNGSPAHKLLHSSLLRFLLFKKFSTNAPII